MANADQNQKLTNQDFQDMLSRLNKILVIRLGQLGSPVVKYVKEKVFELYGYDINAKAIDDAKKLDEIKQNLISVVRTSSIYH